MCPNHGKAPSVPPPLPSGLLQPFSYLTALSASLHVNLIMTFASSSPARPPHLPLSSLLPTFVLSASPPLLASRTMYPTLAPLTLTTPATTSSPLPATLHCSLHLYRHLRICEVLSLWQPSNATAPAWPPFSSKSFLLNK